MGLFSEKPLPLPGKKPLNRTKERFDKEKKKHHRFMVKWIVESFYAIHLLLLLKIALFLAFIWLVCHFIPK